MQMPDRTPRFSVVAAIGPSAGDAGTERLRAFLASVDAQTFPLERVQVVAVVPAADGGARAVLDGWSARHPGPVTIVPAGDGSATGTAAAWNVGLDHVQGEWVTFADPGGVLPAPYLHDVDAFLVGHPRVALAAADRVSVDASSGERVPHDLAGRFVPGVDRVRNLDHDTAHFHDHAQTAFLRADVLSRHGLRLDERTPDAFAGAALVNRYLLRVPEPRVAFLSTVVLEEQPVVAPLRPDPAALADVVEHGYVPLLRDAAAGRDRVPSWAQGVVIRGLAAVLSRGEQVSGAEHDPDVERLHRAVARACALLDDAGLDTYSATRLRATWRDVLRHGYRDESWHTPYAVVDKIVTGSGARGADAAGRELMRVTYRFVGDRPPERWLVNGRVVEPAHGKIRDLRVFDRTVLQERIVWLPLGTLRAVVDGRDLDLRLAQPPPPRHRLLRASIESALAPASAHEPSPDGDVDDPLTRAERRLLRVAASGPARRVFGGAWVLQDRIFNADDSAEHLFAYLRRHRPGVNAWFAIEGGTPDHRRLRRRYGPRVLTHGSWWWKVAMLHCAHLVSSHLDEVVVRPEAVLRLTRTPGRAVGTPHWRLTFLQHGVMKDDLSGWFNGKDIETLVTSTRAEHASVVADHTAYRLTTRETHLTGLPRFDRLRAAGRRYPPTRRDLLLVAPTWRSWLLTGVDDTGTARHAVDPGRFAESEYARCWTAFVNSDRLRDLAAAHGLQVAVLLHPNLQATAHLDTAPHVRVLGFDGGDVADRFARARVLVTDYSSMFFNASYLERPVVYFQFDRDRVLAGGHLGRRGYFDYERDGFGPVALDLDTAVAATVDAVEQGPDPAPAYLERIRSAFPRRDGRCCERVADVIAGEPGFGATGGGPWRRAVAGTRRAMPRPVRRAAARLRGRA